MVHHERIRGSFSAEDFQVVHWHNQTGGHTVYAHLLRTRVKKLGACQILIVREDPKDPLSSTRFFATSRLQYMLVQMIVTAVKRWTVETRFKDLKN